MRGLTGGVGEAQHICAHQCDNKEPVTLPVAYKAKRSGPMDLYAATKCVSVRAYEVVS